MELAAIIPARGGSKGIPRKNIYPLLSKPLLVYTLEAVKASKTTDMIFVSTDSDEIANVAEKNGTQVIIRPKEISDDKSTTESALIHALECLKAKGTDPTHLLTLQPTSPLRKGSTIRKFVQQYIEIATEYDAMCTLTASLSDYWVEDKSTGFSRLFPDAPRRRQDRQPLYIENSAIYITEVEALLNTKSILGNKCEGYVIDEVEAVDINEMLDLKWAEFLISQGIADL